MWKTKKSAEISAGVLNQQRKNFKDPYIVFKDPNPGSKATGYQFGICRTSERGTYAEMGVVFV